MTKKIKKPDPSKPHVCKFCNRGFAREKTLISHMCEPRRRHTIEDEKYVKMGFLAFQEFHRQTSLKKVDYSHFVESQFFTAFTKFGRHMLNINAIEKPEFITFVLKAGVPIDHWCRDDTYETYVRYQTSRESASRAFERNILLMEQWGLEHYEDWFDFFRKVTPSYAVQLIRSGRLSPWLLYNCDTANHLMGKFTEEQIILIKEYINPTLWDEKFKKHREDVKFIKDISKKSGF